MHQLFSDDTKIIIGMILCSDDTKIIIGMILCSDDTKIIIGMILCSDDTKVWLDRNVQWLTVFLFFIALTLTKCIVTGIHLTCKVM